MKQIKDIIAWLPAVSMLLMISAIPYGWSLYQLIVSWMLGISYGIYFLFNQQWRSVSWDRTKWLYVVMLALWAMYPVRQLFDATPPTDFFRNQVHTHEWFLYIGIAGLLGFPEKLKLKHVASVLLATSVVMLLHSGYLFFCTDEFGYVDPAMPLIRFDELRRSHIHSHMVMNLYLNGAVIMGFYRLHQDKEWWRRILTGLAMLCALALIWLSIGRVGKITSIIIIAVYVLYVLYRLNRWVAVGSAVACVLAGVLFMTQVPGMREKAIKGDPREAVWDYSWRMVKEQPVFGYGLSTLSEKYVEEAYEDSVMMQGFIEPIIYTYPDFAAQGKTMGTHHPHNAFLMYWLAVGIIGVLLLLALFGIAACMPVGKDRIYLWLLLLAIFIQSMTEPIGLHLLPQFIAIMLFVWDQHARHASLG